MSRGRTREQHKQPIGTRDIGIEIDPKHYDTAVARIQTELQRTALLEPVPKITQQSFFAEAP